MGQAFSETLLLVDDEEVIVRLISQVLEREGYQDTLTATSLHEASARLRENFVDLLLIDERLRGDSGVGFLEQLGEQYPGLTCVVISANADFALAQRAMRAGAVDILAKPVDQRDLLATVRRVLAATKIIREARRHRWNAERAARPPEIIGNSRAIRDVLEMVGRIASSNSTVLIHGESGTGKELIAKAIHAASPRRKQTMVSVNMAAISPEMIEAELFGAAKGSYTGSIAQRKGYFEEANGSTLFLDEIGDAPMNVQVRLLRALAEQTITRVGETTPRRIDIRLIAATHHNLSKDVLSGTFREDLFFRLNVIPITLPALRERIDDIEPIANHFLTHLSRENGRHVQGFLPESMCKLQNYSWPGNVRELRNVMERAVLLTNSAFLTPADLPLAAEDQTTAAWQELLDHSFDVASAQFERRYFQRLMQRAGGSKTRACDFAESASTAIYTYLKKLKLVPAE